MSFDRRKPTCLQQRIQFDSAKLLLNKFSLLEIRTYVLSVLIKRRDKDLSDVITRSLIEALKNISDEQFKELFLGRSDTSYQLRALAPYSGLLDAYALTRSRKL